jgi:hypothetical protein
LVGVGSEVGRADGLAAGYGCCRALTRNDAGGLGEIDGNRIARCIQDGNGNRPAFGVAVQTADVFGPL